MPRKSTLLLAGDIGGTKTVLALYEVGSWPGTPIALRTFSNRGIAEFSQHIEAFLEETGLRPSQACFGAAGPVLDEVMQLTNLNWRISGPELCRRFGLAKVSLINDLVATAMGAVLLPAEDLLSINRRPPATQATVGIIAPGTGLGEAFLLHDKAQYQPFPSEGGHAAFAPRNQLQIELCRFLLQRHGHASCEQVCSGTGFPNLFAFMQTRYPTPDWLANQLATADNPVPIVVDAACQARSKGPPCPVAEASVLLFVDILAGEAANLALKLLPFGGLYIGGGIPPRILPFLDPERFMDIFTEGVHKEMLGRIPVMVILNPKTALLGAAAHGMAVLAS